MSESEGPWEELRPGGPHVWRTLGYRRTASEPGRMEIEWDATEDYTFPDGDSSIVHGGLVGTVLDTAMGCACAAPAAPRSSEPGASNTVLLGSTLRTWR